MRSPRLAECDASSYDDPPIVQKHACVPDSSCIIIPIRVRTYTPASVDAFLRSDMLASPRRFADFSHEMLAFVGNLVYSAAMLQATELARQHVAAMPIHHLNSSKGGNPP